MPAEQSNPYESTGDVLFKKFNLVTGQMACFEKISILTSSTVPVGAKSEGVLKKDVSLGNPVVFSDTGSVISPVEKAWEEDGVLYLQTSTSVYKFVQERNPAAIERFSFQDVDHVITARGSIYKYLPNWTTQRFKTAENYLSDPKDVLVYVPPFNKVKGLLSEQELRFVGTSESSYEHLMLEYVHDGDKEVQIIDRDGKVVENNKAIADTDKEVYLAFGTKGRIDFRIPVSHMPVVGYTTFDKQTDKDGYWRRHLGNKVTKIVLKD